MRPVFRQDILPGQRKILVLAWFAYTLAYMLRVNIAVVIPAIMADRGYLYTQMGLLTSLFFITYMFGQLINGYLGDHLDNKLMIVSGLALSALCNLFMVLAPAYGWLLLGWGLNGLAQSMLWAPLMRTLTEWFSGRQLERVAFIMAQSMIIGYAFSWGGSSWLSQRFGWSAAFLVPALLVGLYALLLLFFFRSHPPHPTAASAAAEADPNDAALPTEKKSRPLPLLVYFRRIQVIGLVLIAVSQGLIREGIGVWFPTILQDTETWAGRSVSMVLVIVPLVNFFGILFVRQVNLRADGSSHHTIPIVFTLIGTMTLLLLLLSRQSAWVLLVMTLLLAVTHGMTPILTSVIPFQFARFRRVSLTVGLLDFAIYLGAAASSLTTGLLADRYSWQAVMWLWLIAALAGLLVSIHRLIRNKGRKQYAAKIHDSI